MQIIIYKNLIHAVIIIKFNRQQTVIDGAFTSSQNTKRDSQADRVSGAERARERPEGYDRSHERAPHACERAARSCSHALQFGASVIRSVLCLRLSNFRQRKRSACETFQEA